ncbi:MAG TPA: FKBP-type peptidyl-prolyl cis-trans isomerase [Longimicrobium sp.]|jgi:peptidylprolyl isomerase|uniref:FKBP-type peptidyl-prolyl cis-trans isomerase n=1 Tax=Longimicrobium sp. TaxID=2029185 RepID=UPI002ED88DA1
MIKLIRRSAAVLACALPLLAAAACDGDVTYSSPVIEETQFASSLGVNLAASTKTASGMYYRDIAVGTGEAAAPGQTAFVHYTLWLSNGTQIDSNVGQPASFPFQLNGGRVVAGFNEGVLGMKKGGTRQLVIPPSLGYGRNPNGPIPGNSILVFNVLLDSIK